MKGSDFKYRTLEAEVMDDFYLEGDELRSILNDIDKVNSWLGGNKITLEGIKKILHRHTDHIFRIMDVGCGNGNMLREVADFGRNHNYKFNLTGIDANEHAIKIAQELSVDYPEISYLPLNIFSEAFKDVKTDIILCTLTLHHFKEEEIDQLLKLFIRNASLGVVINDLERSPVAYHLFRLFCAAFIDNEIARKDGLISIRRGFRRKDLERLGRKLPVVQEINWKWAFRYQWILYNKRKS